MAKQIIKAHGVGKLEIVNAENSRSFRDLKGKTVELSGAALIVDTNKAGEEVDFAYLFAKDGTVYGGNSATIYRAVDGLIDLMEEEPGKVYAATTDGRTATSGREFLTLRISEVV